MKLPNNEEQALAEVAEGRARSKENTSQSPASPAQNGQGVFQGLAGVRQAGRNGKPLKSSDELASRVEAQTSGTDVRLETLRDGNNQSMMVKLAAPPAPWSAVAADAAFGSYGIFARSGRRKAASAATALQGASRKSKR